VKTNAYFFTRGKTDTGNTKETWIYDMRSNMPTFAKRTPLTREHFADFERAFGSDPYGRSKRKDEGEQGRFRRFTRDFIHDQGDTLDITWLVEDSGTESKSVLTPDALASQIMKRLQSALKELKSLQSDTKRKD
jgi:type I restriction enzyme M protein